MSLSIFTTIEDLVPRGGRHQVSRAIGERSFCDTPAYLTEATLTFSEIPLYESKLEITSPRTDEIIAQLRGRPPK
jgi:hypothetical protein